jgi:HEAT repeat protein
VGKRKRVATTHQTDTPRKDSTRTSSKVMGESSFLRAQTAERIGLRGDPADIGRLEDYLKDQSAEVRMRAVEALGKLTAGRHQALRGALTDTDELVRLQAAESIGVHAGRRTVSALRQALGDRSALVRSYAAAALGRAGTRGDRALLRTAVRRESSDAARLGFLEGVWLLGDRTVLTLTIKLLNSRDYRVRGATARALTGTFSNLETREGIIAALQARLRSERTNAVRQALTDSLSTIAQSD